MNFSAAMLVKQSASQLLFTQYKNLNKPVTQNQLDGDQHAKDVAEVQGGLVERRGIVKVGNDALFFCIDLVQEEKFIELKKVTDTTPDWFFSMSINQSAFYASLLKEVSVLDTPTFRQQEGCEQIRTVRPDNYEYQLWYGADMYSIQPNDELKSLYLEKMKLLSECYMLVSQGKAATSEAFDKCRSFDEKYKFKEAQLFPSQYKLIGQL